MPLPTPDEIRAAYFVDAQGRLIRAATGKATWPVDRKGYSRATYKRYPYLTHRLAWVVHHGQWPDGQIDHVNGDKSDQRLENLRLASASENNRNVGRKRSNTSGFKGVCWDRSRAAWAANIRVDGRKRTLGRFASAEEAAAAYARAAVEHHGEFARTG